MLLVMLSNSTFHQVLKERCRKFDRIIFLGSLYPNIFTCSQIDTRLQMSSQKLDISQLTKFVNYKDGKTKRKERRSKNRKN